MTRDVDTQNLMANATKEWEFQHPDIFEHSFPTAGYDESHSSEPPGSVGRSTDAARSLISTFTSEPDMVYLLCILGLSARSKVRYPPLR